MRFINNIGFILLAVYLLLVGIMAITGVLIPTILIGIVAIAAAVFILIGR